MFGAVIQVFKTTLELLLKSNAAKQNTLIVYLHTRVFSSMKVE